MKFVSRHFAAATLILCPLLVSAQELPSAPSAVIAQHAFAATSEMTFTTSRVRAVAPSPSSRLNSDQKFSSFVEQSMSPYATFSSAIAAGFRPAWNNSQYSETYASRFGHTISDQTEQGFFTKFLLPSVLRQDPRYHPSGQTGDVDRAGYALSRVLIGRNDDGKPTLNTSELIGAVIAASLSTAYHPYRRYTPGETASRAVSGIGADAGMNMLREFWPDIRDQLMDHGPKIMQGLVTRLGPRIQGTAVSPVD
jgi:hypothetical protein